MQSRSVHACVRPFGRRVVQGKLLLLPAKNNTTRTKGYYTHIRTYVQYINWTASLLCSRLSSFFFFFFLVALPFTTTFSLNPFLSLSLSFSFPSFLFSILFCFCHNHERTAMTHNKTASLSSRPQQPQPQELSLTARRQCDYLTVHPPPPLLTLTASKSSPASPRSPGRSPLLAMPERGHKKDSSSPAAASPYYDSGFSESTTLSLAKEDDDDDDLYESESESDDDDSSCCGEDEEDIYCPSTPPSSLSPRRSKPLFTKENSHPQEHDVPIHQEKQEEVGKTTEGDEPASPKETDA